MEKIRSLVRQILKKYDTNCPFELCAKLKIKVIKMNLPNNVKGLYVKFLKNRVIIINESIKLSESKFVCGHELGHVFLHEQLNAIEIASKNEHNLLLLEREADYFCSCFLGDETL